MDRPNFIIFLTDDQGYGDLSCMGCTDFCTPHLDRLAAEGARFTDFYSNSPVCSPARASLLTGRYPGNAGVRAILAGHRTATGLPAHVPTLAEALRPLGYATYLAGKWHLGVAEASRPHNKGFDRWYGFLAGCIDYYSHIFYWEMNRPGPGANPLHDLWEDGREVWHNGRYFTELITEKSVEYLRQAAGAGRPFLLFVAYNAPHYPLHAPRQYVERFAHLPLDRRIMAAMLGAMDDSVGTILAEARRLGAENTLSCFLSDNGPSREARNWLDGTPDPYYGGATGGLKGHKFSLYDGGIRVPGILHWPGRIPPGQVIAAPCAAMDVFPTMLSAAAGDPSRYALDGVSLLDLLAAGKDLPERDIYWEMNDQTAVRRGRWKLVLNGQLVENAPAPDKVHLSDLQADPGEKVNLKDAHPDVARDLRKSAEAWRASLERRWKKEFSPPRQGKVTH